jgi:co-chaperonin GroES (HSP10)
MINEIDPRNIKLMPGRCLIKRGKAAEEKRGIIMPVSSRERQTFEGTVFAINEVPNGEAGDVRAGDRVFFSRNIGSDDSRFFNWGGDEWVLIPCEAIQAVAA